MGFAITVSPAVAGHRWVGIEGRVDAGTAGDVRAVLRTALRDLPTRRLTLDLSRARVGDEEGQRVLAEAAELARRHGIEWSTVDSAPPPVSTPAVDAARPALVVASAD